VAQPAQETGEEEVSVEELKKMLQELEKGKETVTVVPSPVPPAQAQAPLPPAPSRGELVKIYDLIMRLPSKYLVQQSKYVKTETGGVAEQRVWEGLAQQVASRLEGIRRTAYDKIRQLGSFAHVKEFERWVAVTDKAVKDAEELSKWVREELSKLSIKQLRPDIDIDKIYAVKAMPVYLEPEDAKLLLETAIAELEEAREELERRIQEAEMQRKKNTVKKLGQELEYTKQVLEQFKKFLQQLEAKPATTATPQTAQQEQKKKKSVAVTA
jgi:DNA-binding transcriptional MerR regulator